LVVIFVPFFTAATVIIFNQNDHRKFLMIGVPSFDSKNMGKKNPA